MFGNRGKAALSLGSQTLGVRSKDSGRVRCTHGHMYVYTRELRHMGVPLQEVATVLVSATPHTGPGTEESKKNVD